MIPWLRICQHRDQEEKSLSHKDQETLIYVLNLQASILKGVMDE